MNDDRRCVYTVLLGRYERLNEQPVAAQSKIRFVCLTDDPELRSETWEIRRVSPLFGMDPVRSQRDLKIRPHLHLPEFDTSIYIDNCVTLSVPPERMFAFFDRERGFCIPHHSFRDTLLDEFLIVAELGLDDQSRVFEQLNHYLVDCPDQLHERPLWTGLIIRDHRNPLVREVLETWAAHVQRYSRRDQLSVNVALHHSAMTPQILQINDRASWFHSWPHEQERDVASRRPDVYLRPPAGRIRKLEEALEEQTRRAQAQERALADEASRSRHWEVALGERDAILTELTTHYHALEQELSDRRVRQEILAQELDASQARQRALLASASWRASAPIRHASRRLPVLARLLRRGLRFVRRPTSAQAPALPAAVSAASSPVEGAASAGGPAADGPATSALLTGAGVRLYVDPSDQRGQQLVARGGNLNPPTLAIWHRLLASHAWTHIVDVGANYGEMLWNGGMPPGARILAVEPNPHIRAFLERNLSGAGIEARILPVAIADMVGHRTFLLDRAWSGTSRFSRPEDSGNLGSLERLDVATTTLSALLRKEGALGDIHVLLKIDVEGHEIPALAGILDVVDRLGAFAALVELLHVSADDRDWLIDRFNVEIFDKAHDRLVPVRPATPQRFAEMLATPDFYPQDVVLRRKADRPA